MSTMVDGWHINTVKTKVLQSRRMWHCDQMFYTANLQRLTGPHRLGRVGRMICAQSADSKSASVIPAACPGGHSTSSIR